MINEEGHEIVPLEYDHVNVNFYGVAELCNDNQDVVVRSRHFNASLRGVYDLKKRQGLPCIYNSIECKGRNADGFMECECWLGDNLNTETIVLDGSTVPSKHTYGRIAVARDFAVVLKDNGWELQLVGHNEHFRQICRSVKRNFVKLAAGFDGYMALDSRGYVSVGPPAKEFQTSLALDGLSGVKDISASEGHTVLLLDDGTVKCIDEPQSYEGPEQFSHDVRAWRDIKQVVCGFDFVMGLKKDGSLITVGNYVGGLGIGVTQWHNVKQIDAFNCYYGRCYSIAILNNGLVVSDFTNAVERWRNVVKVSVGNGCAVGLRADGRAYAIGGEEFERTVSSWRKIVDIECKFFQAVALLEDGSVVFSMQ